MYSRWALSKIFRFGHDIKDIHEPLRCVSASNSKKLGGEKLPFAWLIARQPYRSSFFTPSDIYKRWSSLLVRNLSISNGWKKWTTLLLFFFWIAERWMNSMTMDANFTFDVYTWANSRVEQFSMESVCSQPNYHPATLTTQCHAYRHFGLISNDM